MMDRRHFKRFTIEHANVNCKMHLTQDVQILDVSMGGASLSLNHNMAIGDEYMLKIDHDGDLFSVNGDIVWVEESESIEIEDGEVESVFKAGMSFKKIFTGKGLRLANLIEDKAHTDKERRRVRGIRVKLKSPEAVLNLMGEYNVKEISFGGLQLEANRKLKANMEYKMSMVIPAAQKPIRFVGRIASSRPLEGSGEAFKTGIEFINMGVKDLQCIQDLIYDLTELEHKEVKGNLKTNGTSTSP